MSSPTRDEIQSQWGKAIKPLNELRKYAATHTAAGSAINVGDNYLNMEDALVASIKGEYAREKIDAILTYRAAVNNALLAAPVVLYPHLREYMRYAGYPDTEIKAMLTRLYQYFADNSYTVNSRGFTFGTPAAGGSNTGTGTVNRLNVDERGYDIENQSGTVAGMLKTAECVADATTGTNQHEEAFDLYGPSPDRDDLRVVGVRRTMRVYAKAAPASYPYISNPSFESNSGTDGSAFTSASQLDNWTMSNYSKITPIASDYYRGYKGCSTPRCLSFSADVNITQALSRVNAKFSPYVPAYFQVAFKRVSSCNGTLTITLGAKSTSVALSAQSGWTILRLGPSSDNWFKNWNNSAPAVTLALSGRSTGSLLVDDIILCPYDVFDGGWYAVVGGATAFLRRDKFTFSDLVSVAEGIIQYWLYRAWGFYLPHCATGQTWDDPS
jgi:hypothetical protein